MVGTSNLGSWNGHWYHILPVSSAPSFAGACFVSGARPTKCRCREGWAAGMGLGHRASVLGMVTIPPYTTYKHDDLGVYDCFTHISSLDISWHTSLVNNQSLRQSSVTHHSSNLFSPISPNDKSSRWLLKRDISNKHRFTGIWCRGVTLQISLKRVLECQKHWRR